MHSLGLGVRPVQSYLCKLIGFGHFIPGLVALLILGTTFIRLARLRARLLSGILFYFFGFWAPIILPLSPQTVYHFPRGTQQPGERL